MMTRHIDGILSPINRTAGFSVIEMDDDAVCLIRNFQTVATFNQRTTAQAINDEADTQRKSLDGVDSNYENYRQQTGPER